MVHLPLKKSFLRLTKTTKYIEIRLKAHFKSPKGIPLGRFRATSKIITPATRHMMPRTLAFTEGALMFFFKANIKIIKTIPPITEKNKGVIIGSKPGSPVNNGKVAHNKRMTPCSVVIQNEPAFPFLKKQNRILERKVNKPYQIQLAHRL